MRHTAIIGIWPKREHLGKGPILEVKNCRKNYGKNFKKITKNCGKISEKNVKKFQKKL